MLLALYITSGCWKNFKNPQIFGRKKYLTFWSISVRSFILNHASWLLRDGTQSGCLFEGVHCEGRRGECPLKAFIAPVLCNFNFGNESRVVVTFMGELSYFGIGTPPWSSHGSCWEPFSMRQSINQVRSRKVFFFSFVFGWEWFEALYMGLPSPRFPAYSVPSIFSFIVHAWASIMSHFVWSF